MPGLMLRRTEKGIAVVTVHYSADTDLSEERINELRNRYTKQTWWDLEMEIKYDALSGQLVYPEFDIKLHVVPPDLIPTRGCRFMAIDPHPRTPHAFLWILLDPWGDYWVYRELWPSVGYAQPGNVGDDAQENRYTIREYCETIAYLERNELKFHYPETPQEYGTYKQNSNGERIIDRFMDQAGKGFYVGEGRNELTHADIYRNYDIVCSDPIKSHKSGEDAIRDLLKIRTHDIYGKWPKLHISSKCPELILEFQKHRYKKSPDHQLEERDLRQEGVQARTHMLDLLRYLATGNLFYTERLAS